MGDMMLQGLRWCACISFLLQAAAAGAQVIKLPSVPTGGELRALVQITATGGSTANLRITLRTLESCGTFGGASQVDTTTDASGRLSFTMTAGSRPGVCTIEGRNGTFAQTAVTTIFRLADVALSADAAVQSVAPGLPASFTVKATAASLPLFGLPITLDSFPSSGTSGTPVAEARNTDANGAALVHVNTNGIPGAFDFTARAFGASRVLRVLQQSPRPPGSLDPPGRSLRARDVPPNLGSVVVSIVDGPSDCRIQDAVFLSDSPEIAHPTGMPSFPLGQVQVVIDTCIHASLHLKLEYTQPIPTDGLMHSHFAFPGVATPFIRLPHVASGNAATFLVNEDQLGPISIPSTRFISTFGLARPGAATTPPAPPAVQGLWWAGTAENGWGMSLVQSATGMFAVIYGYDDAGKPTWWVLSGGTWDAQRRAFSSDVYSPYGTPWQGYDASLFTAGEKRGTARLTFADASNATLEFTLDGIAGRKVISKQVFAPAGAAPVANAGGMYWGNVAQNGWGVVVVQQGAQLFSVWYTYDDAARPTWFVMSDGQWTAADRFEGRMYRTRGSPWLGHPYDPSVLQVIDVGAYRLQYVGAQVRLDYSIDGRTGTLVLDRFAF